ncbi:fatty acid desaturase [Gloeobacter violaceus]|nr:fatty acid desaturase [Gloeobacter violaceus]
MSFDTMVASYASARRVRKQLSKEVRRRSTPRGIASFAFCFAVYLLAFTGFLLLPWWWAKAICSIALGLAIAQLFHVGHDAGHGVLTTNSTLNVWLGRVAFLPLLHAFNLWDANHNQLHHIYTNFAPLDRFWAPLSRKEYDELSPLHRFAQRMYRSGWGSGVYYLNIWRQFLLVPNPLLQDKIKSTLDTWLVFGFGSVQILLLIWVPNWLADVTGWPVMPWWVSILGGLVVPMLIWSWLLGTATYLQHNHPSIAWYSKFEEWSFYRGQVGSTVHIKLPAFWRLLTWNLMEHTAHHVDVGISFAKLNDAQQLLQKAYGEHITADALSWGSFLDTLRRCKLYDYENHRWLDFDGNSTIAGTNLRVPEQP